MKRMILFPAIAATIPAGLAAAAEAAHGSEHRETLLTPFTDPVTHTVMAGIVVFLLIAWRLGAFKAVFGGLDSRAEGIRKELEEAASLREQAAEALAAAERKAQDADKEAEAMIEQAKADAKRIMEEARKDMAERLARREALAVARISRAETEATDEVRRAAADAATQAARRLLQEDTATDQFEKAAREIEKALAN